MDILKKILRPLHSRPQPDTAANDDVSSVETAAAPSCTDFRAKALEGYQAAKNGDSRGMSGFHFSRRAMPFPFSMCGWADYVEPDWGNTQGVGFRIEKECFDGREPLLYYFDDDGFPADRDEKRLKQSIQLILQYSSGIADVRVEQRMCRRLFSQTAEEHSVLVFRLDPAAVKESISLSGKPVSTDQLGGYVFVLPRCGEFSCQLGEIIDDEMLPLHHDNFCMK